MCCRVLFCFGGSGVFFSPEIFFCKLSGSSCFLNFAPLCFFTFFFLKMAVLLQCDRPRVTVTQKMKMFYVANIMILQHNEEYLCFSGNGNTRRNVQGWCKSLQITVTAAVHPFYSLCCSFHFIYSCSCTHFSQWLFLTAYWSRTVRNYSSIAPCDFERTSTMYSMPILHTDDVIQACYCQCDYWYFID